MPGQKISLRHIQIDKSNTIIVVATAAAAACLVFSLVATQTLWKQSRYNAKVISKMETTRDTLKQNIDSLDQLGTSYETFVGETTNIIGGVSGGSGDRDGDNAKITLDALPSVYDFPGTISGFNKLLINRGFSNPEITGSDQEVTEAINTNPDIVEVPLQFAASGNSLAIQELVTLLDNSIRPVRVDSMSFSGESNGGGLSVDIEARTYYQPKKNFQVKSEKVQ